MANLSGSRTGARAPVSGVAAGRKANDNGSGQLVDDLEQQLATLFSHLDANRTGRISPGELLQKVAQLHTNFLGQNVSILIRDAFGIEMEKK